MHDILGKLKTECPFPATFEDVEENSLSYAPAYRKKIGHLRADYDGLRWWNTWWPTHFELLSEERRAEINSVYEALTAKGALADLSTLTHFCEMHPEASVHPGSRGGEYNFYHEGTHCNYWVRLISRPRDYNMYLHAFVREAAV